MLSRTAANLYWMSRYLERAENTVRLLDATQTMALMPRSRRALRELTAPLAITGMEALYKEHYDELTTGNLMQFFVLDTANYNSVFNCIRAARDNALIDGSSGGVERIVNSVSELAHLNLRSTSDLDHSDAASQLPKSFLHFLLFVL